MQGEYGFVHTGFLTPSFPQIKLATYVGANRAGTVSGGWLGTISNDPLHFFTNNGQASLTVGTSGQVGIGATSPAVPLHVSSGWGQLRVESTQNNVWSTVELKTPAREWHAGVGGPNLPNDIKNKYYIRDHTIGADRLVIDSAGNVGLGTLNPQAKLHVAGSILTRVLQVDGGADFAESFDVSPAGSETVKIAPGSVVAIDPARPGKLAVSTRAYDSRVAGIISGAGGVNSGMIMSQEGSIADGQHPVALSGRVYLAEAAVWKNIAWVEREQGQLAAARSAIEQAITLSEFLRTNINSPETRSSFLATVADYYELNTDILMRLHMLEPQAGHAQAALKISERGRARSLLELLNEARGDIRQGVSASLLERERTLKNRLTTKLDSLTKILSSKAADAQKSAARKEINDLTEEYRQVQAEIRQSIPHYAALTQPQPLGAQEIQRLLDDDTLLLEYALGEKGSYLWAVTATTLFSYQLPPRAGSMNCSLHGSRERI